MLEVALDGVLSDTAQLFLEQPSVQVIDDLTRNLAELHDRAVDLGILQAFKNVCGNHPISRIIRQDPYVRRAFEKPRGYAGMPSCWTISTGLNPSTHRRLSG